MGTNGRHIPPQKQELYNILIEIKGASAGGVSKEEWSKYSRQLSILVDKYKISPAYDAEEGPLLHGITESMSDVSTLWKPQPYECYNKNKAKQCVNSVASDLYFRKYYIYNNLYNKETDARILLSVENSSLQEYKDALESIIQNNNFDGIWSDLVPVYLSRTSVAIVKYFEANHISL